MSELTRTTVAIDRELLAQFERWMTARGYANRSEAVRDLIRAALVEQAAEESDREVVGVLSILYDHEQRALAQDLTRLQHRHISAVLCSQHVHLTHHHCLESIVLRAPAGELRELADRILSTRGVLTGRLTLLSAGGSG